MSNEVLAIEVKQWLSEWDAVEFDESAHRREPPHSFLLFSMPVGQLRRLTGIYRRGSEEGTRRRSDLAIQRRHNKERSAEIKRFVRHGYPWSELSAARQASGEYEDLKKPGWLPTAIIVNILTEADERENERVDPEDLIRIDEREGATRRLLAPADVEDSGWRPKAAHPMEVIDGQHRLWAFDETEMVDFELPVVAFVGLDISWQAYVFWTVNIKPKKINASLAYDLYPLLRTEDWLERADNVRVYRETRAQELTELLWAVEESPWYRRINMLGEGRSGVSQAAWIRSLAATFIKSFAGRGVAGGVGGLYGEMGGQAVAVLPWTRAQQAAFLVFGWQQLAQAVRDCDDAWAVSLRAPEGGSDQLSSDGDPAFVGPYTLLNTDQGVRGFLHILNDLCFVRADSLGLSLWSDEYVGDDALSDEDEVKLGVRDLDRQAFGDYVKQFCRVLAGFDWRTSGAPRLTIEARNLKLGFRGSSGYRVLRTRLLEYLAAHDTGEVAEAARQVTAAAGLEESQA